MGSTPLSARSPPLSFVVSTEIVTLMIINSVEKRWEGSGGQIV